MPSKIRNQEGGKHFFTPLYISNIDLLYVIYYIIQPGMKNNSEQMWADFWHDHACGFLLMVSPKKIRMDMECVQDVVEAAAADALYKLLLSMSGWKYIRAKTSSEINSQDSRDGAEAARLFTGKRNVRRMEERRKQSVGNFWVMQAGWQIPATNALMDVLIGEKRRVEEDQKKSGRWERDGGSTLDTHAKLRICVNSS